MVDSPSQTSYDCSGLPSAPEKAAIVGFGVMGAQIAQILAQAGYKVCAYDLGQKELTNGMEIIRNGRYGLESSVAMGKLSKESADKILSLIEITTTIEKCLSDSRIVVEAAVEDLSVKHSIMQTVARVCPHDAILTTNTSTLSIERIAKPFPNEIRQRIIGMHFFNPPQVMKLVEIVRTKDTSLKVITRAQNVVAKLGKTS